MPPAMCTDHVRLSEALARAEESRRHLEDADSRTATAVLALEGKVDRLTERVDQRLRGVERKLAYYAGAIAIASVALALIMKLWSPAAPAQPAHERGHSKVTAAAVLSSAE